MENRYPDVRVYDSTEELLTGLAGYVTQISDASVKERKLTMAPYMRTLDRSKWHLFLAEENLVAKKHPLSTYRQAKEAFISKVPILPAHVVSVAHGVLGGASSRGLRVPHQAAGSGPDGVTSDGYKTEAFSTVALGSSNGFMKPLLRTSFVAIILTYGH
uniref:Glucosamine/galactosamine-6-phosphate isomerase domain-containing protein n=1 Tax=Nelumbo nucifera TaxID=4432 RepID=A0A822Z763_NELNU|nr:TPA_asm: hypothetical protein HUJ06_013824 [Nelumbo nucifera]